MKQLSLVIAAALVFSGCANQAPATPSARPDAGERRIPVPVLRIGQPAAIDLFGDGRATITVATTELSKLDNGDRLVVTIDILLNKAGKPISGGPENFRFRDADSVLHNALTDERAFPPQLPSVTLTTAGQAVHGRLYFDVPAGSAAGGHIQLMTGALVHAVWAV
ncbi:MAG TPA: hypothetical protein VFC19_12875 [Candidatus Limnocylindrales bacterium]|nr:hypothetical protein [Candidatus Limnocylindrales bacterium]